MHLTCTGLYFVCIESKKLTTVSETEGNPEIILYAAAEAVSDFPFNKWCNISATVRFFSIQHQSHTFHILFVRISFELNRKSKKKRIWHMSKRRQLLFNEKKVSHACDDANLAARNMCVRVCPYGLDCSIILENTACLISSLIFNYFLLALLIDGQSNSYWQHSFWCRTRIAYKEWKKNLGWLQCWNPPPLRVCFYLLTASF